jgi:hypothetical protein
MDAAAAGGLGECGGFCRAGSGGGAREDNGHGFRWLRLCALRGGPRRLPATSAWWKKTSLLWNLKV